MESALHRAGNTGSGGHGWFKGIACKMHKRFINTARDKSPGKWTSRSGVAGGWCGAAVTLSRFETTSVGGKNFCPATTGRGMFRARPHTL